MLYERMKVQIYISITSWSTRSTFSPKISRNDTSLRFSTLKSSLNETYLPDEMQRMSRTLNNTNGKNEPPAISLSNKWRSVRLFDLFFHHASLPGAEFFLLAVAPNESRSHYSILMNASRVRREIIHRPRSIDRNSLSPNISSTEYLSSVHQLNSIDGRKKHRTFSFCRKVVCFVLCVAT